MLYRVATDEGESFTFGSTIGGIPKTSGATGKEHCTLQQSKPSYSGEWFGVPPDDVAII
jgi:hypothetical protein